MKKKILIVTLSVITIAALVFVGFKYIWNADNVEPIIYRPAEYLSGDEVLFKYLYAGSNSNYAISTDGKVYAWGANSTAGLGMGDQDDRRIPEVISGLDGDSILQIVKGYSYTMILTNSGDIWGWGYKETTLIGQGEEMPLLKPVKLDINVGEKIVSLATGQDNVLALTENGKLYVWGIGGHGNMGLGFTYFEAPEPVQIPEFSVGNIVQIVADGFTCGVVTDLGEVFIWGQDEYSQEERTFVRLPTRVEAASGLYVTKLSIGRSIAVLTNDGKVYTWGRNVVGELGIGNREPQYEPQEVTALSDYYVVDVVSGASHMMARTEDGRVFAWGYNNRGQTANPITETMSDSFITTPTEIEMLSSKGVCALFAGADYSVALTEDGALYTWGYGSYGQLGTDNVDIIVIQPVLLDRFVKESEGV